jgi:large subunit ribosomal protein L32e
MDPNEKERLMKIRKKQNKKRPSFRRFHSWRYKKLKGKGWRKQRGIDNKTRRKTKTGVKSPNIGYRTPKAIRGLHPSGLEDVRVMHIKELDDLDPEVHGIRIASRLGGRKRVALIEEARDRGFRVLNMGLSREEMLDFEEFEEELEEELEEEFEEELDEDFEEDLDLDEEDLESEEFGEEEDEQ